MSLKFTSKNTLSRIFSRLSEIFVKKNDIVDNVTSTDTDKPLSANQGKVLNESIRTHSHIATDLPYFIANNDSTIDMTLSAVGWYRIAIWGDGAAVTAAGAICNSCEIIFKRHYSNTNNEYHKISLLGIYQKSNFVSELSKSNFQLITKIRHVVDTTSNASYIEFYYNSTYLNALTVTLNNTTSKGRNWTLTTPELTDETIDGVTVYSTMDIPSNSKGTASYDSDGNIITDTYATKTEISSLSSNMIPHQQWAIPAGETRRVLVREVSGTGNLVLFSTYMVIPSYKTIFLASSGNGNNTNPGQNITITTLLESSVITVTPVNESGSYNCFDITNNGNYNVILHANTLYGTQPVMY